MKTSSILTVCMSPTIQKTLVFPGLERDKVNRTGEYSLDAAGKGIDVSRVLTQLGKSCRHLTQLGGMFRPVFLELCSRDGLRVEWVESYSPIRFCYTLIDRTDKSVTELVEESEKVEEGTEARLLNAFSGLISESSAEMSFSTLVISGTRAAGFSDTLIPEMVRLGKAQGLRVILDIRGKDLQNSLPFGPDMVKPNLSEFLSTFAGKQVSYNSTSADDLKKRAEEIWAEIYRETPCSLVLTRGKDPVWYAEKGEFSEYAFESVEAFNTTGSGDAFTAGLAAALEDGLTLGEAVAEGVRCGALNAGLLRPGVIKI